MTLENSSSLILISSNFYQDSKASFHRVNDEYVHALSYIKNSTPVLLPAFSQKHNLSFLLDHIDGILLTGSVSNIHPKYYKLKNTEDQENGPFDERRDQTNFDLIQGAFEKKIPILGICRGFQELNVAFGGTLKSNISSKNKNMDHYPFYKADINDHRYHQAHAISLETKGILYATLKKKQIMTNSLHFQSIHKLAAPFNIEAYALDGTIEAISWKKNNQFCLAVQWHPEYFIDKDPFSQKIFQLFEKAIKQYKRKKKI